MANKREGLRQSSKLPEKLMPDSYNPAIPGFTVLLGGSPAKDESEVRVALKAGSYGGEGVKPIPCNIVLKTTESRIPAWVNAVSEVFKEEEWQWSNLPGCDSGQQCKVRNVTINIYDKGTVMIQGASCVEFAVEYLLVIKKEVDRQCVPMEVVRSHKDDSVQKGNSDSVPNNQVDEYDSILLSQGEGELTPNSSPKPKDKIDSSPVALQQTVQSSKAVQCDAINMEDSSIQSEPVETREKEIQCEQFPSNHLGILKYLQAIEEKVGSLCRELGEVRSIIQDNASSIKTLNTNVHKISDAIPGIKDVSTAVKDLKDNLPKGDWETKVSQAEDSNFTQDIKTDLQEISGTLQKVVRNTDLLPTVREMVENNEESFKEVQPAVTGIKNKLHNVVIPAIKKMPQDVKDKIHVENVAPLVTEIKTVVTEINESVKKHVVKHDDIQREEKSADTETIQANKGSNNENAWSARLAPDSRVNRGERDRGATRDDLDDFTPVMRKPPPGKPKINIFHDSLMDKVDQDRLFGQAAIPCMRKCGTLQNAIRCVKENAVEISEADFNVVHLSINDLKSHSINDVVDQTIELTDTLKKCTTKPIIFSKPLPVGMSQGDLDSKVARYGKRIEEMYEKDNQVFLVDNDSFSPRGFLEERLYEDDKLHINMNGTKKLVFHIKRVLGQWIPAVRPRALRRDQNDLSRSQTRLDGPRFGRGDGSRFGRGGRGNNSTKYQQSDGFEDMNPFQLLSGLSALVKMFN